ncbi:glycosyltransferase family 4 protein [Desulfomicrobium escambiense]|uniref:glycosyltransferase family 4 protein n=1 Tax=Desulfomicrobium escambiense TaxID=29503 RepID=UPI00048E0CCF|nr:glycosyltransferase family 4 protein [Desulfomicrobium escambiense]
MTQRSICFFNTNRAWGGGEQWYFAHARLFAKRGWRVSAVTHSSSVLGDRLAAYPDISVLRVPVANLSFLNPLKVARIADFLRRNRVESVILALPSDLKCGGIAARLAGTNDIIFRRGLALPTKNTVFNRFLFRHVLTKLLCNSEHTRHMVLSENSALVSADRTFVVHNGLDLPQFDASSAEPLVPKLPQRVVIGSAGRLTAQKGHRYLLEAIAILRGRGLDCTLLLAGIGELEQELRQQTADLGLGDCVHFVGFVDEMKRFYSSIDIFALPSLWEGFGYVLTEAMSMCLPVVAFAVSNIPEVVVDRETGLLVPGGSVAAFADALEALVLDPDLRNRLGHAGRARVESHFTLAKTFEELEDVLSV